MLWWLIGHVWIKGGLILTAHLSKLLKNPSWNCCLLPDNVDQPQITPACCQLVGDLQSLAESRKTVVVERLRKEMWDWCCCFLNFICYYLSGNSEQCVEKNENGKNSDLTNLTNVIYEVCSLKYVHHTNFYSLTKQLLMLKHYMTSLTFW